MMRLRIKRKGNCEIWRSLMYNIGGNFDCEALKLIAYKTAMEGTMGWNNVFACKWNVKFDVSPTSESGAADIDFTRV